MNCTLKDSFNSIYRQKRGQRTFLRSLSSFLDNHWLIKDIKVLSNSYVLLTNQQRCGKIYSLHKLHIFIRWRENTLVKSVFSLSSYLHRLGICVATMRGMHFFGAFLHGAHFLLLIGGIDELWYPKKDNRYYRCRADTGRSFRLSWQRRGRLWVLLRRVRLLFTLFSRI